MRVDWDRQYSLRDFAGLVLHYGTIAAVLGGVFFLSVSFVMVEFTAQPIFCTSCHNMRPYYDSWKESTHNMVPCVECHYEPGLMEVLDGKKAAITQVAKYVTRTEGTKPWAEISDNSCMRSGCHSKRLLWGEIQFGRVKFNHRHHLLEARRGKRLRCTTCHSQIVQGSHLTVTTNTCFTCHFLESDESLGAGDCNTCHGPPEENILVDGQPFRHSEWVERGVDCENCHAEVTRGDGAVSKSRCNSCHSEREHIEAYEDVEFVHVNHVTEHKVECLECHNEVLHSLKPLESDKPDESGETHHVRTHDAEDSEDCGRCHGGGHSPQAMMVRGVADPGLEAQPSRMHRVRVTCEACHNPIEGAAASETMSKGELVEVACLSCHDAGFAGMLGQWQEEIQGYLKTLEPAAEALEKRLADSEDAQARASLEEAQRRLALVRKDGSMGAHNLAYTRKIVLRAREDLAQAGARLEPRLAAPALEMAPALPTEQGCTSSCHTRIEEMEFVALPNREFPHALHAADMEMECSECHGEGQHGQTPILASRGCASCHHDDEEGDCAECHPFQKSLINGHPAPGFNVEPDVMVDSAECIDCHEGLGEEGYLAAQKVPQTCVECHDDEEYRETLIEWKADAVKRNLKVTDRLGRLGVVLDGLDPNAEAAKSGRKLLDEGKTLLHRLNAASQVHNPDGSEEAINKLAAKIDRWLRRHDPDSAAYAK